MSHTASQNVAAVVEVAPAGPRTCSYPGRDTGYRLTVYSSQQRHTPAGNASVSSSSGGRRVAWPVSYSPAPGDLLADRPTGTVTAQPDRWSGPPSAPRLDALVAGRCSRKRIDMGGSSCECQCRSSSPASAWYWLLPVLWRRCKPWLRLAWRSLSSESYWRSWGHPAGAVVADRPPDRAVESRVSGRVRLWCAPRRSPVRRTR